MQMLTWHYISELLLQFTGSTFQMTISLEQFLVNNSMTSRLLHFQNMSWVIIA